MCLLKLSSKLRSSSSFFKAIAKKMTDVPDMLMNFPFLDDEGLSLPHWFFDPLFFPSSSTTFNCKLQ